MPTVKVYDDDGRLIRQGPARNEEEKKGFTVRYELMGIIGIMIIQTMGGVWWASSTNTNLYNMKSELTDIKSQLARAYIDRFTAVDAERAHAAIDRRMDKAEARISDLEKYHIKGGK
jgi:hypothetical protein